MREQVPNELIEGAVGNLLRKLGQVLAKRGNGTFTSSHEILGILTEEYNEFSDAVHENDKHKITEELMDVGVTAIFGLACIMNDKMDWL